MKPMYRNAFTMIELIIVIVILGILAALALPRMNDDRLQEAADQILSHVRYAQHLALVDDQYNPTDTNWYKKRWQIQFATCSGGSGYYYVVGRNIDNNNNIDKFGSALNPFDKKYLYVQNSCSAASDESEAVLISKKYGIDSVSFSGCGSTQSIAFDSLGRPFKTTSGTNMYNRLTTRCDVTFSNSAGSFTLSIEPETGFIHITSINY